MLNRKRTKCPRETRRVFAIIQVAIMKETKIREESSIMSNLRLSESSTTNGELMDGLEELARSKIVRLKLRETNDLMNLLN